ncbi:hypothetical protein [Planctomyces sp. SH-PL14]|uniref:HalD/BesD family halogenase n=1 Tax=Planctomyces sp. SH-PL14 TaxID=1632864 RepID=UPI00078CEA06|nr:hypothetical protein [Planctomyces sp. SH-PL14]AMV18485.1 hypothetical protein VT03_11380 [Planctomyces sp. SH-PL14]
MWWTLLTAVAVPTTGCLAWHRWNRVQLYRRLASERTSLIARQHVGFDLPSPAESTREAFAREPIARIDRVLTEETRQAALAECAQHRSLIERSYVPGHKKGGTICYERVHRHLPICLSIYHSRVLQDYLSDLIGSEVRPTGDHDQSSCSVLMYTEAGDHIGWHYDHNFYRGRHFTVLIPLINRSAAGDGVSQSLLKQQRPGNEDAVFSTAANSLILFEGARIRHCATPLGDGELRIMLSMTYATDSRIRLSHEIARRIKDTAFFGVRALWD